MTLPSVTDDANANETVTSNQPKRALIVSLEQTETIRLVPLILNANSTGDDVVKNNAVGDSLKPIECQTNNNKMCNKSLALGDDTFKMVFPVQGFNEKSKSFFPLSIQKAGFSEITQLKCQNKLEAKFPKKPEYEHKPIKNVLDDACRKKLIKFPYTNRNIKITQNKFPLEEFDTQDKLLKIEQSQSQPQPLSRFKNEILEIQLPTQHFLNVPNALQLIVTIANAKRETLGSEIIIQPKDLATTTKYGGEVQHTQCQQEAQVHCEQVQHDTDNKDDQDKKRNHIAMGQSIDDDIMRPKRKSELLDKMKIVASVSKTFDNDDEFKNRYEIFAYNIPSTINELKIVSRAMSMNEFNEQRKMFITKILNSNMLLSLGLPLVDVDDYTDHCASSNATTNTSVTTDINSFQNDDDNDRNESCAQINRYEFKHPLFAQQRYFSDVRDTSSKEVLADIARTQRGTCQKTSNTKTKTKTIIELNPSYLASLPPLSSLAHIALTSHSVSLNPPTTLFSPLYNKLPNFVLLPNYYDLELVGSYQICTEFHKWNNKVKLLKESDNITKSIEWNCQNIVNRESNNNSTKDTSCTYINEPETIKNLTGSDVKACFHLNEDCVEMTLTKIEAQDRIAQGSSSEPPSPVLSLTGEQQDINSIAEGFDEMKFEMRGIKDALPNSLHDRYKPDRVSIVPSPSLARPHQLNTGSMPNSIARSRSASNSAYVPYVTENVLTQQQSHSGNPITGSSSSRLSLSSTPDVKRSENEKTRPVSVDIVDSVLPTRTRLRRQRRMGSQDSTDQNEDPIERLNRLRARISGALSEVKGVLNKYSTETETEEKPSSIVINQTTSSRLDKRVSPELAKTGVPNQTEGPVQFRFVRKVRRRSLFSEDEESINNMAVLENTTPEVVTASVTQNEKNATEPPEIEVNNIHVNQEILNNEPISKTQKTVIRESSKLPKIEIPTPEIKSLPKDNAKQTPPTLEDKLTIEPTLRRASTGQIQKPVALEKNKIKRCPSDSTTLTRSDKPKDASKIESKQNQVAPQQLSSISVKKSHKSKYVEELKNIEVGKKSDIKKMVKNADEPVQKTISSNAKPKKRSSINRSDSWRRASIAAVEKSKIGPPISEKLAIDVKEQRRASDIVVDLKKSSVKLTAPTATPSLINRRPTPKIKTGTKVKRSFLKNENSIERNDTAFSTIGQAVDINKNVKAGDQILDIESMPMQSIKLINDEKSITTPSSASEAATLATRPIVIGKATMPTTIENKTQAKIIVIDGKNDFKFTEKINEPIASISTIQPTVKNSQPTATVSNSKSDKNYNETLAPLSENISKQFSITKPTLAENFEPKNIVPKNKKSDLINETINNFGNLPRESVDVSTDASTEVEVKIANIKKPIHQDEKIPALNASSVLGSLSQSPSQEPSLQTKSQQVAISAASSTAHTAVSVINDPGSATENSKATARQLLSEVNNDACVAPVKIATDSCDCTVVSDANTKIAYHAVDLNSSVQTITTASATTAEENPREMPELRVLPQPVKTVQIHPDFKISSIPFNLPKEELPKKKIVFKKLVKQKSTEKAPIIHKKKNEKINLNKDDTNTPNTNETDLEKDYDCVIVPALDENQNDDIENLVVPVEPPAPPAPPKRPRKVKKKVIIKRQQRKLSISDQTFFSGINNEPAIDNATPDIETLEKPIAYVTDDEGEGEGEDEPDFGPTLPLKGCMRQREFEVGEFVMYAERYKKTQVRWKKGRVIDRITSISYKLDIDGNEVAAHISYIKRYTERKVSFGGKEYLEIDYEQIEEAEEKARRYSIWNVV